MFSTVVPSGFMNNTGRKYDENTFRSIRQLRTTIELQKCKYGMEYLRFCLIYNLIQKFVNIALWRERLKKQQQFLSFKRHLIQQEYYNWNKEANKHDKLRNKLIKSIQCSVSISDYLNIQKYMYEQAKYVKEKIEERHNKKLTKINKGPIGENSESTRHKLIDHISSYLPTPTEERLLCTRWNFCIKNNITNTMKFQTDIEINTLKIEPHCHPSIFSTICRYLHDHSQKFLQSINKNLIRNISDEEFTAIKTLKNNKKIIISCADKGNAIVILDKKDYIEKAQQTLKSEQFQHVSKLPLKQKEDEMNKFLRQLHQHHVITKELFYQIRSTSSSLPCMYGQPKVHKHGYPIRQIVSLIGNYSQNT